MLNAPKFPLMLAVMITPPEPPATNNPFPAAMLFKSAAVPVCDADHVNPSGEVKNIPPAPTATNNCELAKYVMACTELLVPVVPTVHVTPSGDDITSPLSPNATNSLFWKITPRKVVFATTGVSGSHVCPLLDSKIVPFSPTAKYTDVLLGEMLPKATPKSSFVVPEERIAQFAPSGDDNINPTAPTAT
jgi:hypothetical protein